MKTTGPVRALLVGLAFALLGGCNSPGAGQVSDGGGGGAIASRGPGAIGGGALDGASASAADATMVMVDAAPVSPPDVQPARACDNPAPCTTGELVMEAQYWCFRHDDPVLVGDRAWPACKDGKLTGYYAGVPCPFDLAVAHTPGWTGPCDGCIDGVIITNGGGSTSASWRATSTARYCCDGRAVRRLRCD